MYQIGFYETEITPALGSVIPGDFGARYNRRILDPLYARAVVITLDDKTVGIVTVDCTGLTEDIAERIRDRAMSLVPLTHDAILVNATHCHGSGPTLNWGEEVRRSEEYLDFLVLHAGDALAVAYQRRTEAVIQVGASELRGYSFIRDYRMKDGSLKTNPGVGNPEIDAPLAEIDPEVRVLSVQSADGKPLGAIVNFACHPAIVADDRTSADYIGALSERLKEYYGARFVTVFINGACGNINHVNTADPASVREGIHIALGQALAEKVKLAIEHSAPAAEALQYAYNKVTLRRRKPNAEQLLWACGIYDALGEKAAESRPGTPGYVETFFAWQTFTLAQSRELTWDLPVQALRIGKTAIFGCPCQIYVEYGNALKKKSPGAMVCAFSNAYGGYVPTPNCINTTIYEGRIASTSQLEPAAGDKLVEALGNLL